MHPFLNIALNAARAASKVIVRAFERIDKIKVMAKGLNDFVSEVDQKAEREIIKIIHKAYPAHKILGEESGLVDGKAADNVHKKFDVDADDYTWIIDPLDGTVNYLHGYPHFAVSIAVAKKNKMQCGLIYDPLTQEVFRAAKGGGAYCNNRRIRTNANARQQLSNSLIGLSFAHSNLPHVDDFMVAFKAIEAKTLGVRRSGSAVLDLAYVAAGRLDGWCGFGVRYWDIAAGALLVREALGLTSDFQAGQDLCQAGNIVAASSSVFKELLPLVHKLM